MKKILFISSIIVCVFSLTSFAYARNDSFIDKLVDKIVNRLIDDTEVKDIGWNERGVEQAEFNPAVVQESLIPDTNDVYDLGSFPFSFKMFRHL